MKNRRAKKFEEKKEGTEKYHAGTQKRKRKWFVQKLGEQLIKNSCELTLIK